MIGERLSSKLLRLLEARSVSSSLAVVGDLALDRYLCGTVERISREAPIPVVVQQGVHANPGCAGNGAMNLTDVEKNNPIGSAPEVCAFNFDGANKVGSPATAFGDIRYRPDAGELYKVFLTFDGKEYGSDQPLDTAVVRESNQVRFNRTTLTATDGSANTLRVSGVVPMRSNRPSGC